MSDTKELFSDSHFGPLFRAARDVLAERDRQKSVEGWTEAHDDEHTDGSLAVAAARYALMHTDAFVADPEERAAEWIKPCDARRALEKAGALILAELERRDRATPPSVVPDAETGEQG